MDSITIRRAERGDAQIIADFNRAMAHETEDKTLVPEVVLAGVETLLESPALGFYLVAIAESKVVATLMVTMEWSDWRNGLFWWVQSVYVEPGFRRRGIYRRLYEFVKDLAENETNVCGFRLYVERENEKAQATYSALGMAECPYRMFEEMRP